MPESDLVERLEAKRHEFSESQEAFGARFRLDQKEYSLFARRRARLPETRLGWVAEILELPLPEVEAMNRALPLSA